MPPAAATLCVVIPAHNAAATVARSVRSAVEQQPPPHDVVVVDDGSSDGTGEVAARAGARVLRHSTARGAAAARDAGVRSSSSDLISFLDADDHLGAGYVGAVTRAAQHGGAPSLIIGRSIEHHEDGTLHRPPVYGTHDLANPVMALAWDNRVPTSATTVPRWAYEQSGGFDPAFPGSAAEDYDLWLRLALLGPFVHAADARVHRVITRGSTSRRPQAALTMLRNGLLCVTRNAPAAGRVYPPFARVATAHVHREAALRCLDGGDNEGAASQLAQALRANPADPRLWAAVALWLVPPALRGVLLQARQRVLSRRHEHHAQADGHV